MPDSPDNRPLLVTLSARALSSLGFGLSIIAMSLEWLFPTVLEKQPVSFVLLLQRQENIGLSSHSGDGAISRRQSAPPIYSSPRSRPVDEHSQNPTKHVSFIEGTAVPPSAVREPHTSISAPAFHPCDKQNSRSSSASSNIFLSSPTQTLVDCSDKDSDAGVCSSPSKTSFLRTLSIPKYTGSKCKPPDDVSDSSSLVKPSKKHGRRFVPWHSRSRSKDESPAQHSRSSSPSLLPFLRTTTTRDTSKSPSAGFPFSRSKKQRRCSMPVPRTSPYDAPYFATPPISFEEAEEYFYHDSARERA
ncbi:hypothetical protein AMATHDRAFT_46406 [Amanita thiersii Skay4041]|uniref:Uncharacterized protein n=1 Tax=Amanita thiersii Skay4041 TaxID=703135 RepID=A0A2A9NQ89_9AGAR|nr:hypothetical protein AMATHDRAFT_46406 [Amanita thiersii Skay4041]